MKCIDYDAEWLASLAEDHPAWKKEFVASRRNKGKKPERRTPAGRGERNKPRKAKRKASPIDTTSDDGAEDDSELTDYDYDSE